MCRIYQFLFVSILVLCSAATAVTIEIPVPQIADNSPLNYSRSAAITDLRLTQFTSIEEVRVRYSGEASGVAGINQKWVWDEFLQHEVLVEEYVYFPPFIRSSLDSGLVDCAVQRVVDGGFSMLIDSFLLGPDDDYSFLMDGQFNVDVTVGTTGSPDMWLTVPNAAFSEFTIIVEGIPEPATVILMGLGVALIRRTSSK
jgi:hypothetical protein